MEIREFVQGSLDRVKQTTTRVAEGLNQQELAWRAGPECNSIGIILFHMARFEDRFVQGRIQGKPEVWELEKWYEKLNLASSETGGGYTPEQVVAFRVPELKELMAYTGAVQARTLEYLKAMTDEELAKVVDLPRLGNPTVGVLFTLIITHLAQHAGEISYLRGVQRGANK
ncbi:MAG: hypothetical protein HW402_147 [Dehalococcoidales bacterium]|nr:hypothetical protein [Dehalococcoidales bacterium]